MKAVLIVHNVAIGEEVNEVLSGLGIECFTKFTNVLGKGVVSEPHLNTPVWPGVNCATLVVVDEAKANEVMEKVRQMRGSLGSEGVKAFVWDIEEVS